MLSRMFRAYLAIGRTFGVWFATIFVGWYFMSLKMMGWFNMLLDPIFFPKLNRTKITSPIVIVGNPRSGTTFIQRFLCDLGLGVGMQIWRMLFPSLVQQALVKPLLPILEKVSPAKFHNSVVHETSLTSVETDDPALVFRFFDGFFVYGFVLGWADHDYRDEFDPSLRDTSVRDFGYFESIWRRNLVANGATRMVAKPFSLIPRIPQFLKVFPDARVLFMLRDPLAVVPSAMSLVTGVLDAALGFWKLPEPTRQRFVERLYSALLILNKRFHEQYTAGQIPANRIYFLRYDRMMAELEVVMDEIFEFVEVVPTEEMKAQIKKTAEKQRAWKSGHKYDLAKFGLDEARILRDYAFFYETYGVPRKG